MKDSTQTVSTHMEVENYKSVAACQPASGVGTLEVVQGHHTASAFIQIMEDIYTVKTSIFTCTCC